MKEPDNEGLCFSWKGSWVLSESVRHELKLEVLQKG